MRSRLYYVLDERGEPRTAGRDEWARWMETADRHIAFDKVGKIDVSTVFLGLDHNFSGKGPPILWESMVFGGTLDGDQRRYASRDAAERGHAEMLALVQAAVENEKALKKLTRKPRPRTHRPGDEGTGRKIVL